MMNDDDANSNRDQIICESLKGKENLMGRPHGGRDVMVRLTVDSDHTQEFKQDSEVNGKIEIGYGSIAQILYRLLDRLCVSTECGGNDTSCMGVVVYGTTTQDSQALYNTRICLCHSPPCFQNARRYLCRKTQWVKSVQVCSKTLWVKSVQRIS